jgi:arginyl-tRNA synthetase
MREALRERFRGAVGVLLDECGDAGEPPDFALEVSRSPDHGDFACNAALVLAKRLRQPPRAIAERLAAELRAAADWVERAEVAGPGFVNVWLREARWHHLLRRVLEEGRHFGHSKVGRGRRVQVEFVSANPTGPLTLGHGRQGVLGDCIARILVATGYDVTREYYFNDGGRQMRVLGESVKGRYLEQLGRAVPPPSAALADPEAEWPERIDGRPVVFPRDGYQGDYTTSGRRSIGSASSSTSTPTRCRCTRTVGSSRPSTISAPAAWSTTGMAPSGCALRNSASTGIGCWSRRPGSRRICCPTWRITGRSSSAASTR